MKKGKPSATAENASPTNAGEIAAAVVRDVSDAAVAVRSSGSTIAIVYD